MEHTSPTQIDPNPRGDHRILVGHAINGEYIVIGLDSDSYSLVHLHLDDAAKLARDLTKLVRNIRRANSRRSAKEVA